MTRRLYDFQCEEGHTTELFIDEEIKLVTCGSCPKEAKRIISPILSLLDPMDDGFAGAKMKWAREHEKAANKR
jgi:hypothetical protein